MASMILANDEGQCGMSAAIDALRNGGSALDAVEKGIRAVESDPTVSTVGYGGRPNILGEVECDASIMCGMTLRAGAVGALKNYYHAISVARQIMERMPHVMLVGEGAALFAAEIGEKEGDLLSHQARIEHAQWIRNSVAGPLSAEWPHIPLTPLSWASAGPDTAAGTTCFLVRTSGGDFAGGVSTSGWAYKYPGRLGDSPIIGAGLYVDRRYGAAACTRTGEMTMRAGTARAVILYMKKGAMVQEACHEALDDLRALRGGYLGPVVIHALDKDGSPCVLTTDDTADVHYWTWAEGMRKPARKRPVIELL
jgi:beta-aspartyl-peptidase (threonine type)